MCRAPRFPLLTCPLVKLSACRPILVTSCIGRSALSKSIAAGPVTQINLNLAPQPQIPNNVLLFFHDKNLRKSGTNIIPYRLIFDNWHYDTVPWCHWIIFFLIYSPTFWISIASFIFRPITKLAKNYLFVDKPRFETCSFLY